MAQVTASQPGLAHTESSNTGAKRKRGPATETSDGHSVKAQSTPVKRVAFTTTASPTPEFEEDNEETPPPSTQPVPATTTQPSDLTPYLKKIALSQLTPFQKRVLTALCQVPPGKYTTYGVLAKHLASSPRAVGNALRNNPFAPQVPCHRVLASGGGLGGFKGSWGRGGEKGKNDGEKTGLLTAEGVRFDPKGMAVGNVWEGFK